jgi:hypothetical protein
MYWLKMCPRCQGDLYLEEDRFGRHVTCLQCGRGLDSSQQIALGILAVRESSYPREQAVLKEA